MKKYVLEKVDKLSKDVLDSVNIYATTFVYEIWRLSSRTLTLTSMAFLRIFNKKAYQSYYDQYKYRENKKKEKFSNDLSSFAQSIIGNGESLSEELVDSTKVMRRMEKKVKKKDFKKHHKDPVYMHQKVNTGFIEDSKIRTLVTIGKFTDWIHGMIHKTLKILEEFQFSKLLNPLLYIKNTIQVIKNIPSIIKKIYKFRIKNIRQKIKSITKKAIISESYDTREREEVITSRGYPFEKYKIITEDGYILTLERIPNKKSKKAIYLQHGVLDSAFSWFAQNLESSAIAFLAHDMGYDVFVGTFRGCLFQREHINPKISAKQYWDFSVNEHAFKDFSAFIRKIKDLKMEELGYEDCEFRETDISIAIIAHSMGAMAAIMYIVYCKMNNLDHFVKTAILLSPAGYHKTAPKLCRITGPIISLFLKLFPNLVFSFRIPEFTRMFFAKLFEDINRNSSTRRLMSYLFSKFLGGHVEEHPVTKAHNLTYNLFAGTSAKVFKHFWQIWKSTHFQSYDYGSKKLNEKYYGQPSPINFFDNYKLVDIPIHFVMGMNDHLIKPESIIHHYDTLHNSHPDLSYLKSFPSMGHLDFTVGNKESLLSYLFKTLEQFL